MIRISVLFAALLLVGISILGCTKSGTVGPQEFSSDKEFLQYAVNNIDSIAGFLNSEEATVDDDGEKEMEYSMGDGFPKLSEVQNVITPLRWGRRIIPPIVKTVEVDTLPGDTLALVAITKIVNGNLIIVGISASGDTVRITKLFSDTMKRNVLFRRVARLAERQRNWVPVAMSLVEGKSSTNDFAIREMSVTTPMGAIVVTNPLNTWMRFGVGRFHDEIPRLRPMQAVQVRVRIESHNDSTELVALRWGVGYGDGRRHRDTLQLIQHYDSAGVHVRAYGRTLLGHRHEGHFNVVVDALSYGTLYDDSADYSNKFWGMPYVMMRP